MRGRKQVRGGVGLHRVDDRAEHRILANVARKARKAARRRKQRRRRRFLKAVAERTVRLGDDGVAVDRGGVLRQFVRGIGAAQRQYIGLGVAIAGRGKGRSEEHTSELQSLMRISYAVFCLKKKTKYSKTTHEN